MLSCAGGVESNGAVARDGWKPSLIARKNRAGHRVSGAPHWTPTRRESLLYSTFDVCQKKSFACFTEKMNIFDGTAATHLRLRGLRHSGAPVPAQSSYGTRAEATSPVNHDALIQEQCARWRRWKGVHAVAEQCPCAEALRTGVRVRRLRMPKRFSFSRRRLFISVLGFMGCGLRYHILVSLDAFARRGNDERSVSSCFVDERYSDRAPLSPFLSLACSSHANAAKHLVHCHPTGDRV